MESIDHISIEQKEAAVDSDLCVGLRALAANDGPSRIDEGVASVATNGSQSGRLGSRVSG